MSKWKPFVSAETEKIISQHMKAWVIIKNIWIAHLLTGIFTEAICTIMYMLAIILSFLCLHLYDSWRNWTVNKCGSN